MMESSENAVTQQSVESVPSLVSYEDAVDVGENEVGDQEIILSEQVLSISSDSLIPYEEAAEMVASVSHDQRTFMRSIMAIMQPQDVSLTEIYQEDDFAHMNEEQLRALYRMIKDRESKQRERDVDVRAFAQHALEISQTLTIAEINQRINRTMSEQNELVSLYLNLTAFIEMQRKIFANRKQHEPFELILIYTAFKGQLIEQMRMMAMEKLIEHFIIHAFENAVPQVVVTCENDATTLSENTQVLISGGDFQGCEEDNKDDLSGMISSSSEGMLLNKARISKVMRDRKEGTLLAIKQFRRLSGSVGFESSTHSGEKLVKLTMPIYSSGFFAGKIPSMLSAKQQEKVIQLETLNIEKTIVLVDDVLVNLKFLSKQLAAILMPGSDWKLSSPKGFEAGGDWNHLGVMIAQIQGWSFILAANGAIAYEIFKVMRSKIVLLITDEEMPVMKGTTLVHHIRSQEHIHGWESLPMAIYTGNNADQLQMSEQFIKDVLQVPVMLKAGGELKSFIEQYVSDEKDESSCEMSHR